MKVVSARAIIIVSLSRQFGYPVEDTTYDNSGKARNANTNTIDVQ